MGTTDLLCQFISWLMNEDGSMSDAAKEWFGTVGTGTGGGSTAMPFPTGVTATIDRLTDVRVSWSPVSIATSYSIFRGITSDTDQMQQIATQSDTTPYLDTTAVAGTHYFYMVKAANATLTSLPSLVAEGVRKSASGNVNYGEAAISEVHVPAGATLLELQIWGGGAPGGINTKSTSDFVPAEANRNAYGGSGASGAFLRVTGIPVNDTQVFFIDIGKSGEPTYVYRGTAGSADHVFANTGNTGDHNATWGTPGAAGQTAGTPGGTTIGGTIEPESTEGNAGNAGATRGTYMTPVEVPAPAGGDAVTYDGYTYGKGGAGTWGNTPISGNYGYVRMLFT